LIVGDIDILSPSTVNGYGSNLAKHIIPEFTGNQLTKIGTSEIVAFGVKLSQKGLSNHTVRGILILLGQILEAARREEYIRETPMRNVDLPEIDKNQKGRALSPAEVSALLAQCNDKLRPVVLIGLLGGLRRSEVFALHWTDDKNSPRSYVDFENNLIRVRQSIFFKYGRYQTRKDGEPAYIFSSPKSATSIRDVSLSPALKRELLALKLRSKDKVGLLFQTDNGTPVDPNNVCRWESQEIKDRRKERQKKHPDVETITLPVAHFDKAVEQANIGAVRFHDLRHSFGSHKLAQGCSMYDVMRWMGHSSIDVTVGVYGHPIEDHGQSAAQKTDAFLGLSETAVAAD